MITNFIAVTIHVCHHFFGSAGRDDDKSIHPQVGMNSRRLRTPNDSVMTDDDSGIGIHEGQTQVGDFKRIIEGDIVIREPQTVEYLIKPRSRVAPRDTYLA